MLCRKVQDCLDVSGHKCFISDYIIPNGSLYTGKLSLQNIHAESGAYLGNSYELHIPKTGVSFCNAGASLALENDKRQCERAFDGMQKLDCENIISERFARQSKLITNNISFTQGRLSTSSFVAGAESLIDAETRSGSCFWLTLNKPLPFKLNQVSNNYKNNNIFFAMDFQNSILMSDDERFRLQILPNYANLTILEGSHKGFSSPGLPRLPSPS